MNETKNIRLAQAILLFYNSPYWTHEEQDKWEELTGKSECTTKNLCELAREILKENV